MKNLMYWFFIHDRYNSIVRKIHERNGNTDIYVESYLDSKRTSRTYIEPSLNSKLKYLQKLLGGVKNV